jgi:tRNA-dihydrouridine synthase 3
MAERRDWDISAPERLDLVTRFASLGLGHWGSDGRGVESTRRFLLAWLSYTHRYVPLGLLSERLPDSVRPAMAWRPPPLIGRSDLETLLASPRPGDWVRISEMVLGPAPASLRFMPKHKSRAYVVPRGEVGGGEKAAAVAVEVEEEEENG